MVAPAMQQTGATGQNRSFVLLETRVIEMSTQALRFFARDDAFRGVGVHFMLLEILLSFSTASPIAYFAMRPSLPSCGNVFYIARTLG